MKKTPAILFFISVFFVFLALAAAVLFLYMENDKLHALTERQQSQLDSASRMLAEANKNISYLNASLKQTEDKLSLANGQLGMALKELNETKQRLEDKESELKATAEELNATKNLLNLTRAEFASLALEVSALEESINESIQWFRENSFLPSSIDFFTYRVQSRCIDDEKLNLACISYLMDKKLNFKYISESEDKLFSINDIVSRKGGDCEDFSLFLKATLNSIRKLDGDVVVEAWASGEGRYVIYEEKNETKTTIWYVDGEAVRLGRLQDFQPYVVCFAIDSYSGHCVIALSERNITSVMDMDALDGAALFEPQNGMYLGKIGKNLAICDAGISVCERKAGYISFVIADNDLYQFKNGSWKNYDIYMQKAVETGRLLSRALATG